jgi:ferredoxin-like protein FixX
MDEVITEQLTIEYNGGCRPRDVCTKGSPIGRKRELVACSKCCDIKKSPECNSKLCGIKSSNTSKCYHCESGADHGTVDDPDKCTNLVSCQSHEVCGAETYRLAGKDTYEFKCVQFGMCQILMEQIMLRMDECNKTGSVELCGNIHKREASGDKICTACCADSQCNSDSCEEIVVNLYSLWKGGVLDIKTLKTTPKTGGATGTTTSPSSG